MADASQEPTLVTRHDSLRGVLDHNETVPPGDSHDGVHLAADTGVVHSHDRLGPARDGFLDLCLIDIERIWSYIDENRHSTAQHEGICRGNEGVRGHDHLVARLYVG